MPIEHLPPRLRPPARKISDWSFTVGPELLLFAFGAIARGISYLPVLMSESAQKAHPVEGTLPMSVWAWVWMVTGVAIIISVWWRDAAPLAVGVGVALNVMWGGSFIADAIIRHSARGWLPAVGYISVPIFVLLALRKGARERKVSREEIAHELRRE